MKGYRTLMSQKTVHRDPKDIQKDYNQYCAQLGDLLFKDDSVRDHLGALHNEKENLLKKMKALAAEAAALPKLEAVPPLEDLPEMTPEEAAAPSVEPSVDPVIPTPEPVAAEVTV